MNSEQLTLKAQQAIESSIRLAATLGNQEVTPLHLSHIPATPAGTGIQASSQG